MDTFNNRNNFHDLFPGNDIEFICYVLGLTLNSFVVVQGMRDKLLPWFVLSSMWMRLSDGKPPAGKGVGSVDSLSLCGSDSDIL